MKIGQLVTCTLGSMKGKEFTIAAILKDGYFSCEPVEKDGKYYQYPASCLKLL